MAELTDKVDEVDELIPSNVLKDENLMDESDNVVVPIFTVIYV